jgi:hypothetical protein
MKFKTLDDYYNWSCDWCDSENRTLWVRVASGEIRCGACHRPPDIVKNSFVQSAQSQMMSGLSL